MKELFSEKKKAFTVVAIILNAICAIMLFVGNAVEWIGWGSYSDEEKSYAKLSIFEATGDKYTNMGGFPRFLIILVFVLLVAQIAVMVYELVKSKSLLDSKKMMIISIIVGVLGIALVTFVLLTNGKKGRSGNITEIDMFIEVKFYFRMIAVYYLFVISLIIATIIRALTLVYSKDNEESVEAFDEENNVITKTYDENKEKFEEEKVDEKEENE